MRAIAISILFTSLGVAHADEPAPPPPDAPVPPPDEPKPPPVEATPEPPPPAEPGDKPGVNIPSTTQETTATTGPRAFDDLSSGSVTTTRREDGKAGYPKIAIELSGAGGQLASPFIVYKGWTLENGATKGTRLEGQLGGIMLAYELSSMSNTRACNVGGCLTGDFGSTTFHVLELGYRYRMSMIGPLRPFITGSLGGVRGNAGNWAMQSGAAFGGVARAGFGVEIPIAGRFFASGVINYRLILMQNPYRTTDGDVINTAFIGSDDPNGDFVDDAHLIGVNVGVGVSL